MSGYTTTIGLEVHAELSTKSKMWCGCANVPLEIKPNSNICEVCLAHPGTLPVANKEAIKKVIKVGLAVGGKIADFTEFDRKNYFYPDIPKGYQLSQYKFPIVSGGEINGIKLTRIHLEEDTAKSTHDKGGNTLVDYNRAGVPLMELVTEPVIHDAETAGNFAKELQRILRYVDASEANMEMGQMRVEANISVSSDPNKFGTKVEVKNLNSFKSVTDAIKYEVERHIALIESGNKVTQETRGWDESKGETFSQRIKENAHDYRYFPDPDLPKFYLKDVFDIDNLKNEIGELPNDKRNKYKSLNLQDKYIEMLVDDKKLSDYFDKVVKISGENAAVTSANYLLSDAMGNITKNNSLRLPTAENFSLLMQMIISNEISSRGAKDILAVMMVNGQNPKTYAEQNNLIQKSDPEALKKIIDEVISENPGAVSEYKNGKESMFMFFVGQAMKKSKGSGNPQAFQELLRDALK